MYFIIYAKKIMNYKIVTYKLLIKFWKKVCTLHVIVMFKKMYKDLRKLEKRKVTLIY